MVHGLHLLRGFGMPVSRRFCVVQATHTKGDPALPPLGPETLEKQILNARNAKA